jgi:hypothetical protein
MITARYDSNNDNFKISVTVKNGSLLYKGSVDIYYYENKISFPFIDLEFSWPTTYVSNTGYGEFECKVYITNGISYNYIIQGSHSVTQIDRDEKRGIYEFSITNNPFYSDCNIGVTVTLQSPQYFTLNYDQLNTMDG